ncbi:uncharacterized protein LACBIDRAFT_328204 [Laccaria bicolor S238N-H82]|uniref:Predicted protein n=1 Tax=Laccaria bicolor (strain S238N-H82 / ATCC MYA-4686) TaxID=486041 RepID=B0DE25_LACBS|nr:uncharacterized protein LACBIDRAFT_328204 [Laccaria bicolor S238N-H82]EDR07190.1 predicted protein [Laccaria bicolor S238N-H82]|eukprot:XP_001882121.1 predicted protein [Laccaria bicolor S238N-H82]
MAMSTLPGHDHTSSSTPSLDGKGGMDSAAKVAKSTKKMGPSYVYYRLYTKLGTFESNNPLYSNDRFIGRIPLRSFAPPHTVASIKLSLCGLEDLSEPDKALLFTPLSSPAPKEDSVRLSLYAPSGPDLSEHDPIALVVESEKRTEEVSQSEKLPERSDDTDIQYGKSCRCLLRSALISFTVHYRVYLSGGKGDKKAKTSFDESDISLGRINTLFIAPPHTAGSLKACSAKLEGLVTPGHARYEDMELFQDMNSDAAMSGTDVMTFEGDAYPGSDEGDPVALINATANTATDQKVKPIPGNVLNGPDLKGARINYTWTADNANKSTWLSIIKDEIVHTDGVIVSVMCRATNSISLLFCFVTNYSRFVGTVYYPAYMMINSKGEKGFVYKDRIDFL